MVREFNISRQSYNILLGTIAVVGFFFAFLYFSLQFAPLILLSELFFVIVILNLLNRAWSKSDGLFQNETAVYLELGLAIFITILINQLGLNYANGLIIFVGVMFVVLLVFLFIQGIAKPAIDKGGRRVSALDNRAGFRSGLLKGILITVIALVEFLVLYYATITYALLTIGAILFTAFILSSLVIGNALDNRRALAFLVVSLFIIFAIQQMAIYKIIPQVTTPQSLLNVNTAVILSVIIFVFFYAFSRFGLVKGEQVSIYPQKRIG